MLELIASGMTIEELLEDYPFGTGRFLGVYSICYITCAF